MNDFEYANKSLTLAAREKNLDGATVAYVQLTLSCVNLQQADPGLSLWMRLSSILLGA